MASTKVFGKIDLSWKSDTIVLPVDKAAQFLALYAEGIHRSNGEWNRHGLVRCDRDGNELALPSMEVLTDSQVHDRLVIGQEQDDKQRAERAAEQAAEQAKAEKANA